MQLTIWTHWEGKSWTGDAPISRFKADWEKLEAIFRFFNRVDDGDHERMAAVGYLLPSLSVGDKVLMAGQWWDVAVAGFTRGEPPTGQLGLPTR